MIDLSASITQEITTIEELKKHGVRLFIKRDDLIHPEISGNKWRKLKYNIERCVQRKNEGVLTFGGAYSNHLVATAAACSEAGLKSVGVVRGDELNPESNDTLKRCSQYGMKLVFVSREEYHLRYERLYHEELLTSYPNLLIVEEGGANYMGMIGCQEIVNELDVDFDRIVVAQGTTTTSCGIGLTLGEKQLMSVVPALKGFDALNEMKILLKRTGMADEVIEQVLEQTSVLDMYHFGGYGKYTMELLEFIRDFYRATGIKLDPVYTGKAMYALMDQVRSGNYENETIVFVHTGGVQGAASIIEKSGFDFFS